MPELPEVETIKRQIQQEIVGEVITHLEVREEKIVMGERELIKGKKITGISRRGKYLFVKFEDGSGIQIHLKMTGRLVLEDSWYEGAKHTRVVITLKSGRKVYYWDTRKFGYIKVERDIQEAEEKVKRKLGKDPWEMSDKELYIKLQKTGRAIKEVILDQSIIAGVGNIYASDALWKAGIDPRRSAKKFTHRECKKLLVGIREVMGRSLAIGGASDNTYRDFLGKSGAYQDEFLVYGKTKGRCPKCKRELIYLKIGGRGTWRCEKCQK